MSKAADRLQLRRAVLALLSERPGSTAYMVNAGLPRPAPDRPAPMQPTMTVLKELAADGLVYSADNQSGACWYLTGNEPGNDPGLENRTGDEEMTTRKTPAEKEYARQLAAAKRSLKIIGEAATRHAELLNSGEIPADTFVPSVLKYDQAMTVLAALNALNEPGAGADDGTAEVSRDDLQGLVTVLQGFGLPAADGTPLGRLAVAAAGPPWDTGAPAEPDR